MLERKMHSVGALEKKRSVDAKVIRGRRTRETRLIWSLV
jgi:hypothetical protein